jgi:hypothetical protein
MLNGRKVAFSIFQAAQKGLLIRNRTAFELVQNHNLARSILNMGFGEFG